MEKSKSTAPTTEQVSQENAPSEAHTNTPKFTDQDYETQVTEMKNIDGNFGDDLMVAMDDLIKDSAPADEATVTTEDETPETIKEVKEEAPAEETTEAEETSEETPVEDTDVESKEQDTNNDTGEDINMTDLDFHNDKFTLKVKDDDGNEKHIKVSLNDIQAQYGRSAALNKESRETKADAEKLKNERSEFVKEREIHNSTVQVNRMNPGLSQRKELVKNLTAKVDAAAATDDYELSNYSAKLGAAERDLVKYESAYKAHQNVVGTNHANKQKAIIEGAGIGHILSDKHSQEAHVAYAKKNLSPDAAIALEYDGTLNVILQKAMAFDKAQLKGKGKSLKSRKSSLSSVGKKVGTANADSANFEYTDEDLEGGQISDRLFKQLSGK